MAFEKVITEVQAKQKAAAGIQVVDLRDPISFRDGAIANSVNLNLRQISMFSSHPKDLPIVLVGDPSDPSTLKAALRYVEGYGLTDVSTFTPPRVWKP